MKLFTFYRITFIISFLVLLFGSMVKVTPDEFKGMNGEHILLAGFVVAFVYILLAFIMMLQSKQMAWGEKLIWVVLFSAGLVFQVPLILFIVGLVFFIIGPKRLQLKA